MGNDNSEDKTFQAIKKYVQPIGYVLLGIVAILLFSVILREGSVIITSFFKHLQDLLNIADLRPSHSNGFAGFIELLAIAVFVGWTINRLKNKK